jgi:hypothetical protein
MARIMLDASVKLNKDHPNSEGKTFLLSFKIVRLVVVRISLLTEVIEVVN